MTAAEKAKYDVNYVDGWISIALEECEIARDIPNMLGKAALLGTYH